MLIQVRSEEMRLGQVMLFQDKTEYFMLGQDRPG